MLAGRIAAAHPESNERWSARVVAAHEQLVAASRPALMVLLGAVAFLLLIVCANMANLLLARLSSRRREIAVRGALGAGRWEVARPILAEVDPAGRRRRPARRRRRRRGTAAAGGAPRGPAAAPGPDPARWRRPGVCHRWSRWPSRWPSASCRRCARPAICGRACTTRRAPTGSPYASRVLGGLVVDRGGARPGAAGRAPG